MLQLTNRERSLAIGLAVFVSAWTLFAFAISPATKRIKTLNRVIPEKQRELEELRVKSTQYIALLAELDEHKQKAVVEGKGFELLPFLEALNDKLGLSKNAVSMKQQVVQIDPDYYEVIVEIEFEDMTFDKLMEFFHNLKISSKPLQIKSIYAKKDSANPNMLDSEVQISTLKLIEAAQN